MGPVGDVLKVDFEQVVGQGMPEKKEPFEQPLGVLGGIAFQPETGGSFPIQQQLRTVPADIGNHVAIVLMVADFSGLNFEINRIGPERNFDVGSSEVVGDTKFPERLVFSAYGPP